MFFFFFKQKTAYEMRISDWSSDVCSSDLSIRPMISSAARLGRFLRTSWDGPHSSAGPKLALLHPRNHAVSFGALSSRARRARTVEPETRDKEIGRTPGRERACPHG